MTIHADELTKRYGPILAVDGLTFQVLPGRVTGFLGPNGASKSTTVRLILGLDAPTAGTVTVGGVAYGRLRRPLFEVGAMLESAAVHPGRSAHAHLLALAQANAIPRPHRGWRSSSAWSGWSGGGPAGGEVLATHDPAPGRGRRIARRPGRAALDEPVNGLDPEGVVWIRTLLRTLAGEGRTVFVSSHLMSEMALTAEQVIVIGRGQLIADTSVAELVRRGSSGQVRVRSPHGERLARLLRSERAVVQQGGDGALVVAGVDLRRWVSWLPGTASSCTSWSPSRLPWRRLPWRRRSWSWPATPSTTSGAPPTPERCRHMATTISPEPTARTAALGPVPRPPAARPLAADLVRAEWTKLRSVRSTWWALAVAAASMVGLGALFAARYGTGGISPSDRAGFDPIAWSLSGFFVAQLAVGVLGVLAIISENASGSSRATFAAALRRRAVLAAKAAVVATVIAVVGIVSSVAAFLVGQAVLADKGLQAHLGDHGVVRSVVGAGLYLAVLGLLALGLGALVRSTVGAIAVVTGVVFILPGIVGALPSSWEYAITPFLPSDAGQALIGRTKFAAQGLHLLSPWVGLAVVCAYAATALVAAAVLLRGRDA